MDPEGTIIPCPECGKQFFALLERGWLGEASCPHCGMTTTIMNPGVMRSKVRRSRAGDDTGERRGAATMPYQMLQTRIRPEEVTRLWKAMHLPPKYQQVAENYFEAIIASCIEKDLVLTEDHGLFVCVPPEYLKTIPVMNIARRESLQVISSFFDFLERLKRQVDQYVEKQGRAPAGEDDYWSIFEGQMRSMIKESGALPRIKEIDKRYGL